MAAPFILPARIIEQPRVKLFFFVLLVRLFVKLKAQLNNLIFTLTLCYDFYIIFSESFI